LRFYRLGHFRILSCVFGLLASHVLLAQSAASRPSDPQALLAVQAAIASMGAAPVDSAASGTIVIVAGSSTEKGTVRILTRGTDQSLEEIQLPNEKRTVIYSRGQANEVFGGGVKAASQELVASSYSASFPLPHLAAVLNDPEMTFQYVGSESMDGTSVHHIRFWKTYASQPKLAFLADFTRKDLWIDATTGLPHKLAYQRRESRGPVAPIRIELFYSDWRKVDNVEYPFRIDKSWNGIPWTTTTIESVVFQNGLTENNFQLQTAAEAK